MPYKRRILAAKLRELIADFPVVIVSGARQVGKSTLVRHELPGWESVVLDPAIDVGDARRDPDLFLDNHPAPLVLDEIQYAPELVSAIKRRVDRNRRPGLYVLTGSQQWAVLKNASESLAGRAVFLDLEGFCLSEIEQAAGNGNWLRRYLDAPEQFVRSQPERLRPERTLYEQIWRGFLPEADSLKPRSIPPFYRAYLRTYIERDAKLFADVGEWQQFGRFVQLAAALTAQEINYSQLGREIGIAPQTAQRWLAMLKATFQWFEVPAYSGNTVKRISSRPKGYFADTGLACALNAVSTPRTLAGHPLVGALFETAVVAEIRKLASALDAPPGFYHWRGHASGEVDLLLERDGIFHPIEVKLSTRASSEDASGFEAFRKTYPKLRVAPGLVIAPVDRAARISETDFCIPWDCR